MMDQPADESQRAGHLSGADAMRSRVERDPQLRSTITAVLVLDGSPDRATMVGRLERMSRSVPGCRHRLVMAPLSLTTPRWTVDRDFDLSYHLRWIAAPQPKTLDTVFEYARQSAMSGLDRDFRRLGVLEPEGGAHAVGVGGLAEEW
jgi:diacylglycerol O-acyltransferase